MSGENNKQETFYLYKEGKEPAHETARPLWEEALKLAHHYFDDTNLVLKDGKVGERELDAIGNFLADVANFSPTLNPGTQAHFYLTEEYTKSFVSAFNARHPESQISLDMARCAARFHDIGRIFSHRSFRNDLLGERFLREVGVQEDIIEMIPDDRRWLANNLTKGEKNRYKPSLIQDILELADVLGKPPVNGKFFMPGDIFNYEQGRNAANIDWGNADWKSTGMWPSEFRRQQSVNVHRDLVQAEYQRIVNWFEGVLGYPLEEITKEIEKKWNENPFSGYKHT